MNLGAKSTVRRCAILLAAAVLSLGASVCAQEPAKTHAKAVPLILWVDQKTGQVFVRPGHGRTKLELKGALIDPGVVERRIQHNVEQKVERNVEQKTQQQIRSAQTQLHDDTAALTKQVAAMKPAWQDYLTEWKDKFHLGLLFYGDYALYTHTGFGPQNLTQIEWPGPGNELYNSFDITRTYIDLRLTPTPDWLVRLTPNIYRTIGGGAINQKFGTFGGLGSNLSGDLGFRLKYGYLQYRSAFANIRPISDDTVTIGQQPNPLVGWEEDLYGYRFVNLTPWNYLSLSSSQTGVSIQGPVRLNERTYLDYDIGVYTNASFHALEATNTKQVMARVSYYPFGALRRFQGLGLTAFYDYGYGDTTPDLSNISAAFKGPNAHITRLAAIVHYTGKNWGLAGEYDYGKNAFASGNLFTGSGPADAFGLGPTPYAGFATMAHAILDTGDARQEGFDFFGHYHVEGTPFTLFGMFQQFEPNTGIGPINPLDFQRFVVGAAYRYDRYLRFAADAQNLTYYHSQFTFPAIPAYGLTTAVAKPVPRDTHVFMLNVEFRF